MPHPLIQLALDVTSTEEAIMLGKKGVAVGVDWLEVGKPLVEFEGLKNVGKLADAFPGIPIVIDLMIIAGAERYVRYASELGASSVTVSALAPRKTVEDAIYAGNRYAIDVTVDLFNVPDVVEQAAYYGRLGASLMVHYGTDQKRANPSGSPITTLERVKTTTGARVSYATYDADEAVRAVQAGADVIVQGEPLLTQTGYPAGLREFVNSVRSTAAPSVG